MRRSLDCNWGSRFVNALQLEDVVLVLHDWGGPFGLSYAANNPENVRGVVFFETPFAPVPNIQPIAPEFVARVIAPDTARQSIVEENWFVDCFLLDPQCFPSSNRTFTDIDKAIYRAPFRSRSAREQLYQMLKYLPFADTTGHPEYDPDGPGGEPPVPVPDFDLFVQFGEYLRTSETPKFLIYGIPGQFPGVDQIAARIGQLYPNARAASIGSEENPVLHFIQEDAPEELSALIADFVLDL